MTPHEPPGLRFFDGASQRDMLLVYEPHDWAGWLCYRHPDGQWVSLRKATEEDRARIDGAVVESHHRDDDAATAEQQPAQAQGDDRPLWEGESEGGRLALHQEPGPRFLFRADGHGGSPGYWREADELHAHLAALLRASEARGADEKLRGDGLVEELWAEREAGLAREDAHAETKRALSSSMGAQAAALEGYQALERAIFSTHPPTLEWVDAPQSLRLQQERAREAEARLAELREGLRTDCRATIERELLRHVAAERAKENP